MQRRLALSACLAAIAGQVSADYTYAGAPTTQYPGMTLVFQEEFDGARGSSFDTTKWGNDLDCTGWGNESRMCYTARRNESYVADGTLNIQANFGAPRLEDPKATGLKCGGDTGVPACCCNPNNVATNIDSLSAQVSTKDKFSFRYGKLRVRAKVPTGYWTWPAIWLMAESYNWPADGELDIFEGVGKSYTFWLTNVHYQAKDGKTHIQFNNWYDAAKAKPGEPVWSPLNEEFHVFGLDWTKDGKMVWSIDEQKIVDWGYRKGIEEKGGNNPFDTGFYSLILNVAIGGHMFGIEKDGSWTSDRNKPSYQDLGADSKTWSPMQVDWVRLWQPTDDVAFRVGGNTTQPVLGQAPASMQQGNPGTPSKGPEVLAPPAQNIDNGQQQADTPQTPSTTPQGNSQGNSQGNVMPIKSDPAKSSSSKMIGSLVGLGGAVAAVLL